VSPFNRREFLKSSAVAAAAASTAIASPAAPRAPGFHSPSTAGRGLKLACSTAVWSEDAASLEKALAGISAAGYEWVEATDDQIWPYRERPAELKSLLQRHGLGLVTVALRGNFADREQRLKNISRSVLLARVLEQVGAGALVIEGDWGAAERTPLNFHTYSTNLAEAGALVFEETGLHCAYRFHEAEAADVRKIIATSDSRYTKFCFDTEYFAQTGIDPVPMIQAYGPRLIHVHLRDGEKTGGNWRDLPVGKGSLQLRPVMEALCQSGFNGWVTVQQTGAKAPAKDAGASRRYLSQQLEAAALKYPDRGASEDARDDSGMGHDMAQMQQPRRSMLSGLVMIGAAIRNPSALLQPAAFQQQDGTNPMQQATQDMKRPAERRSAPLLPKDPNFAPLFFTAEQYADVSALADTIVPVTNTPGALDARADEYADLMIWLDEKSHDAARAEAERFRDLCTQRQGKLFAQLSPSQRVAFLNELTSGNASGPEPAREFFNRIREWTVRGYYTSPQGLLDDLGYKGNTYVAEFKGCTHPEHHQA